MTRQEAEARLDLEATMASIQIRETVRLTTLAMRAARFGMDSLDVGERYDLFRWYGFDMTEYRGLIAKASTLT